LAGNTAWIQNTKYKLDRYLPGGKLIAKWGEMVSGANWL